MLKVGITGGLGSGKTTVASMFAQHGVTAIDTDEISHELTARNGEAIPKIREVFGESVFLPDGTLDRGALRARALAADSEKRKLEDILHPMIRDEAIRRLLELDAAAAYVLVVVPLLVETGTYESLLDRVLVVDCSEETQLRRALARGGWSEAEIRAMMNKQASRKARLDRADDIINTDCEFEALNSQVVELHKKYLALARQAL